MWRTGALTTLLLTALASPAVAQDEATIQKLKDQFGEAFNRADAAGVAAFYTEDAYLLPPGADTAKGRAAVQNFWKAAAEKFGDMKLTTADVMPLGRVPLMRLAVSL